MTTAADRRPGARASPCQATRCRSTASITSSCTSATPSRRRTSSSARFGFRETAYAGLETGSARPGLATCSSRGASACVVTGTMHGGNDIARHVADHGDGVKVIALLGPRHRARPIGYAVQHGARGLVEPYEASDERWHREAGHDRERTARPCTRSSSATATRAPSCPASRRPQRRRARGRPPLRHRPHRGQRRAGPDGRVGRLLRAGLRDDRDDPRSATRTSPPSTRALMSKVMADGNGRIKFPINEPAEGKRKSQIEEYLEFYGGAGVQHIALVHDRHRRHGARRCRTAASSSCRTPDSYYQDLPEPRSARSTRTSPTCDELGILVDRDDEGYLLQIFTQAGRRPADAVLRGDRAARRAQLRRGQLQGAVRGDRARAGRARGNLLMRTSAARRSVPPSAHAQFARERPPARRGGPRSTRASPATSRSSTTIPVALPDQGGGGVRADRAGILGRGPERGTESSASSGVIHAPDRGGERLGQEGAEWLVLPSLDASEHSSRSRAQSRKCAPPRRPR